MLSLPIYVYICVCACVCACMCVSKLWRIEHSQYHEQRCPVPLYQNATSSRNSECVGDTIDLVIDGYSGLGTLRFKVHFIPNATTPNNTKLNNTATTITYVHHKTCVYVR